MNSSPIEDACWVLTDGAIGMENQGVALAEAVGLPIIIKRVATKAPWRWLPLTARLGRLSAAKGGDLAPPGPRLVISIGRHSVPLAIGVKRASGGSTYALHIQNPRISSRHFDLVAAPIHDGLEGENVITTIGAPHRVTTELIGKAGDAIADRVSALRRPYIAVLIGGDSKAFQLTHAGVDRFCDLLRNAVKTSGGSLLVTPSRRTGAENIARVRANLADLPHEIWDQEEENPYFAYLGLADAIVVTADSVNMVTEAAGTGKPIFVFHLEGNSERFDRFHDVMSKRGATREFEGLIETWRYEAINDTEKVAKVVREALGI
jgi:hypothetical protein